MACLVLIASAVIGIIATSRPNNHKCAECRIVEGSCPDTACSGPDRCCQYECPNDGKRLGDEVMMAWKTVIRPPSPALFYATFAVWIAGSIVGFAFSVRRIQGKLALENLAVIMVTVIFVLQVAVALYLIVVIIFDHAFYRSCFSRGLIVGGWCATFTLGALETAFTSVPRVAKYRRLSALQRKAAGKKDSPRAADLARQLDKHCVLKLLIWLVNVLSGGVVVWWLMTLVLINF